MLLSEKIAFIPVGQCGGNIVKDLEDITTKTRPTNDIQSFYINSSLDDLDASDIPLDRRYHISGTQGMAKDQEYALKVITSNENDEKIAEAIFNKYANAKMYFLVFGCSGGTGGGMANQIALKLKEFYPEKVINAIIVKPHNDEDMKMHYNANKCLSTVKQYLDDGIYTNIQLLDNNNFAFDKKLELNNRYVKLLNRIIHLDIISKDGNLDEEEMERLFTRVGMLSIHEISNEDFITNIAKGDNNSLFYHHKKIATTHGLILNSNNNTSEARKLIRDNFGIPTESHYTLWDEDSNIIIPSGIEFTDDVLNNIKSNYANLKKMRDDFNKSYEKEETSIVDVDFSDIIEQSKQPKESVTVNPATMVTRGRRGKKLQGQLNK